MRRGPRVEAAVASVLSRSNQTTEILRIAQQKVRSAREAALGAYRLSGFTASISESRAAAVCGWNGGVGLCPLAVTRSVINGWFYGW